MRFDGWQRERTALVDVDPIEVEEAAHAEERHERVVLLAHVDLAHISREAAQRVCKDVPGGPRLLRRLRLEWRVCARGMRCRREWPGGAPLGLARDPEGLARLERQRHVVCRAEEPVALALLPLGVAPLEHLLERGLGHVVVPRLVVVADVEAERLEWHRQRRKAKRRDKRSCALSNRDQMGVRRLRQGLRGWRGCRFLRPGSEAWSRAWIPWQPLTKCTNSLDSGRVGWLLLPNPCRPLLDPRLAFDSGCWPFHCAQSASRTESRGAIPGRVVRAAMARRWEVKRTHLAHVHMTYGR